MIKGSEDSSGSLSCVRKPQLDKRDREKEAAGLPREQEQTLGLHEPWEAKAFTEASCGTSSTRQVRNAFPPGRSTTLGMRGATVFHFPTVAMYLFSQTS